MNLIAYFSTTKNCVEAAAERVTKTIEAPKDYAIKTIEARKYGNEAYTVLQAEAWFVMATIGELANDGDDSLFNVEMT